MIAEQGDEMQRDYWYDSSRMPDELATPEAIGHTRHNAVWPVSTVANSGPANARCCFAPILPRAAAQPVWGDSRACRVNRKSTFLLDQIGADLSRLGALPKPADTARLASAPFDNEGVATAYRELVSGGVLQGYLPRQLCRAQTGECRVPPVPVACATRASRAAASRSDELIKEMIVASSSPN